MKVEFAKGLTPLVRDISLPALPKKRQRSAVIRGKRYFECPICSGYFDTFHLFEGFGKYAEVFICVGCMRKVRAKIEQARLALGEAKGE